MKKFTLITLALFMFIPIILSQVPTDGMVGYWPFNGNANDESTNTNHGTVKGAFLSQDRFGAIDSAYGFDGIDDLILISGHDGVATFNADEQFSISLWVNIPEYPDCYLPLTLSGPIYSDPFRERFFS